jgi:hypothetical protein
MADNEDSSERQDPVEENKKKKETDSIPLPILVEFTYTSSAIILILLFLTMIGISLLTNATLLDTIIRTTVTMLVIGGLLIFLSRQISSGVVTAIFFREEKSEQRQSKEMVHEELENQSSSEAQ